MKEKADVWQGTLALMILKTLEALGPLHGYGIARRIEQTSANHLVVNYGTLYPSLLRLEQEGYIASEWGVSDNNRKAKFYTLTRAGRKHLEREAREWARTTEIVARFLTPDRETSCASCAPGSSGSPTSCSPRAATASCPPSSKATCSCTSTTT